MYIYIYRERERERTNVSCTQAPASTFAKLTKELTTFHAAGSVYVLKGLPPPPVVGKSAEKKTDPK
jgi:hypothetical protein